MSQLLLPFAILLEVLGNRRPIGKGLSKSKSVLNKVLMKIIDWWPIRSCARDGIIDLIAVDLIADLRPYLWISPLLPNGWKCDTIRLWENLQKVRSNHECKMYIILNVAAAPRVLWLRKQPCLGDLRSPTSVSALSVRKYTQLEK